MTCCRWCMGPPPNDPTELRFFEDDGFCSDACRWGDAEQAKDDEPRDPYDGEPT